MSQLKADSLKAIAEYLDVNQKNSKIIAVSSWGTHDAFLLDFKETGDDSYIEVRVPSFIDQRMLYEWDKKGQRFTKLPMNQTYLLFPNVPESNAKPTKKDPIADV